MDDLVSRQDVIDALMNDADWADAIPTIKSLPSSEPTTKCIAQIRIDQDDMENLVNEIVEKITEPKMGEWVEIENGEYLCSNCSHITIGYPPSYCPNCGARIKGDKEK